MNSLQVIQQLCKIRIKVLHCKLNPVVGIVVSHSFISWAGNTLLCYMCRMDDYGLVTIIRWMQVAAKQKQSLEQGSYNWCQLKDNVMSVCKR